MKGPLSGVKIIDLSSVISGPVATVLLCDQGAEVIKIESLDGDIVRRMGAGDGELSPSFLTANRGKRSLAINLKDKKGTEIIKKLVLDADVFVQNFRPGVIERIGLGYEVLKEINPRLLYVSISGFGEIGPYAQKRVYDPVIQALTGLPDIQADNENSRPKMVRTIIPDKVTALTAAQAITAGLFKREKEKGNGQHIKVAMVDATIAFLWAEGLVGLTSVGKEKNLRRGQLAQDLIFETADGFITCGAVSDSEWKGLCSALEQPAWLEDERFSTPLGRVLNAKERLEGMSDVLVSKKSADWIETLEANDVPCAPVLSRVEMLENEQIKANEIIYEYEHPKLGMVRQARPGAKFSESKVRKRATAPALGENSKEILSELGLDPLEIEKLFENKIVLGREKE